MGKLTTDKAPLYNSRIVNTYIKFLKKNYGYIDTAALLAKAGMEPYQVADEGHWFTQEQINAFHEELLRLTGNPHIARQAGRFGASSESLGLMRQYVLGLIGPAKAYEMLGRYVTNFTRSSVYEARKAGPTTVEITVTPKEGVMEEPFQCENRIGYFEAIASAFNSLPEVEHAECIFKGGSACRYKVSWLPTRFDRWKKVRNYLALALTALFAVLLVPAPLFAVAAFLPAALVVVLLLSLYVGHLERVDLNSAVDYLRGSVDKLLSQTSSDCDNLLTINEIGLAINKQTKENSILEEVVKVLEERLDYDRGLILLSNPEKTRLIFRTGFGYTTTQRSFLRNAQLHLDRSSAKGVFVVSYNEKRPFLINDIDEIIETLSPRSLELAKRLGAKSFICCPIVYEDESLGILAVDNIKTKRPLLQSDINLLMGITPTIGISIRNARLFAEKERQFRSLLQVMASTIDARDPLTAGHSEMVTKYAVGICRELDMPWDYCEMIRVASLLHDYGKVGTRDSILLKPGRLNAEERDEIKTHAVKTEDILRKINFEGIYKDVPLIAGCHHEKIDGSGYPKGLKGEEIPLGARIIAVADVFEALTSKRHYREPMPVEVAMNHLREFSGTLYDPNVVDAFSRYFSVQNEAYKHFDSSG